MPRSEPLPSDASSPVRTWRAVVRAVVGHQACAAEHLQRLLDDEPTWVPALCLRGFSLLFAGRRAFREEAREWADRAEAARRQGAGQPGDDYLIEALRAWSHDDGWAAEAALAARLERDPTDLFTVKLQHGLLFLMGEPTAMRDRIERHVPQWGEGDPDAGYLVGAQLFARVECGDAAGAHEALDRWGDGPADDTWGLHAVAHLFHEAGELDRALGWLDERQHRWAACDRFGNHLDWHRALLQVRLGRPQEALALFDDRLRGVFDGNYRDMSNAVSILWRLHARGVDVGPRWHELAEASHHLVTDHGSAFADAHYLLAHLYADGSATVQQLLGTLAEASAESGHQASVYGDVGQPLCDALAQVRADPQRAAQALGQVLPRLVRIGGSHAQRSLFEDMYATLSG